MTDSLSEETLTPRAGIVLTGPTGAGKTDLSLRLADEFSAQGRPIEIVSADAVSIYRELEIGTAKPSREDRAHVRHHLIDIRSIADSAGYAPAYSAGEFLRDFLTLLPSLPDPALVVGGTAFYIDAIVRGLAETPPADPDMRERLMAEEAARAGAIFDRLTRLDPESACRIGPSNLQRLLRALEVCDRTGGKFSEQARRPPAIHPLIVVISPDRSDLYGAINERVRRMFDRGLVEETASLLGRFPPDLPAFSIIGYAEAARVVRGEMSRDAAVEETARRTRHLAKRQLTWWRNVRYENLTFMPGPGSPADILAKWKERGLCADT